MALKKRGKVNAQFNMSSLTDIIFLLLIFFMLTSSLVAPNALNLKLPGTTTSKPPSSNDDIDAIVIGADCGFSFNGQSQGASALETSIRKGKRADSKYSVTIAYKSQTPVECVVQVMDMARRFDVNGILVSPKAL